LRRICGIGPVRWVEVSLVVLVGNEGEGRRKGVEKGTRRVVIPSRGLKGDVVGRTLGLSKRVTKERSDGSKVLVDVDSTLVANLNGFLSASTQR